MNRRIPVVWHLGALDFNEATIRKSIDNLDMLDFSACLPFIGDR